MPTRTSQTGSELFIIDNSAEEWKGLKYLHDWCEISRQMDIATGYFEIGALLGLKEKWQQVDKIRILMGDEVSPRTKKTLLTGMERPVKKLDDSLEAEKEKNEFLAGVEAIVEAIRAGKIECRVYTKDKFHAKAYITHARMEVVGAFALVGSSNFTLPGLTENIELNVQITGTPVKVLQEWFEQHWNNAEDVREEILKVFERQIKLYRPFDVYAKSLYEFFRGHAATATEWERDHSKIYPRLAPYQREGYHALLSRAEKYRGAFLCDGVGLGKTYIGLMLIERLIQHDRRNVLLLVPKSGRKAVWESTLQRELPEIFGKFGRLEIYNHTDLLRGGEYAQELESIRARAEVIIVDEAHNFRNTGIRGDDENDPQSRYWKLFQMAAGKQLYLLTATPINNRLIDLLHMIQLFSRGDEGYFKDKLGIHNLKAHFAQMEKSLEKLLQLKLGLGEEALTDLVEAEKIIGSDDLFRALVVQRSRAYVMKSEGDDAGKKTLFPSREAPRVQPYSIKQTYGRLLHKFEVAFSKEQPLFTLATYNPYDYYKGDPAEVEAFIRGRQKQVVALIRTGFLKRFESSIEAFRMSCWNLLKKLLVWVEAHVESDHEKRLLERWKLRHAELIGYMKDHQKELFASADDEPDDDDAVITPEMIADVEKLERAKFKVDEIIDETLQDLDQIAEFLDDLKDLAPAHDKKLAALVKLLKNDPVLSKQKVLIFSEFMDTAQYLEKELVKAKISDVGEIDSRSHHDRAATIRRFSPYYNNSSSAQLMDAGEAEIRVLIATDVLSEGLNLQDATRMINYDLHWNPVRLMQRIGRVDRRMSDEVERKIVQDHPEQKALRGKVAYWNFLPPDEMNELLTLYTTVTRKTLRISKTMGIEGKKLLKEDDDYQDLKNFTDTYEGTLSPLEEMNLALQKLLKDQPDLETQLSALPGRLFSGRQSPKPGTQSVFFCYALPELRTIKDQPPEWMTEGGPAQWYLYDLASQKITEEPTLIHPQIQSEPGTPRHTAISQVTLKEIRQKIERHIKDSYLRKLQAPIGVKPVLIAWMELA